jgi:hypothetical protein
VEKSPDDRQATEIGLTGRAVGRIGIRLCARAMARREPEIRKSLTMHKTC